ncbi:hypothetical protein [Thiorhodospira sibirica]|uniref:hypothetical protein n=1 Tax=Thiorhodospira sibirica TaxID=154347 RepID=UPI00022C22EC|nr:hypothetical protein [Thiorhodospira sibirica]
MRWPKPVNARHPALARQPLAVELDQALTLERLARLQSHVGGPEGLAPLLKALHDKHLRFVQHLDQADGVLRRETLQTLLAEVFTARRKLLPQLELIAEDTLHTATAMLLHGAAPLDERMQAFAEMLADPAQPKTRRAAWDFAAELVHFYRPQLIPLLSRWVFDEGTMSGAVREFIRVHPSVDRIALQSSPEQMESVRHWLSATLKAQGFYHDLPWLVDLLLAQAYADYVSAMSGSIGMIEADFASRQHPLEFICTLLGIKAVLHTLPPRLDP